MDTSPLYTIDDIHLVIRKRRREKEKEKMLEN